LKETIPLHSSTNDNHSKHEINSQPIEKSSQVSNQTLNQTPSNSGNAPSPSKKQMDIPMLINNVEKPKREELNSKNRKPNEFRVDFLLNDPEEEPPKLPKSSISNTSDRITIGSLSSNPIKSSIAPLLGEFNPKDTLEQELYQSRISELFDSISALSSLKNSTTTYTPSYPNFAVTLNPLESLSNPRQPLPFRNNLDEQRTSSQKLSISNIVD